MMISTDSDAAKAPSVVLYTRHGCHLCEEAKRVLEDHGLALKLVDIDANPDLRTRFGTSIPVVEIAGRIRFRGRVDPVLLKRILAQPG